MGLAAGGGLARRGLARRGLARRGLATRWGLNTAGAATAHRERIIWYEEKLNLLLAPFFAICSTCTVHSDCTGTGCCEKPLTLFEA